MLWKIVLLFVAHAERKEGWRDLRETMSAWTSLALLWLAMRVRHSSRRYLLITAHQLVRIAVHATCCACIFRAGYADAASIVGLASMLRVGLSLCEDVSTSVVFGLFVAYIAQTHRGGEASSLTWALVVPDAIDWCMNTLMSLTLTRGHI